MERLSIFDLDGTLFDTVQVDHLSDAEELPYRAGDGGLSGQQQGDPAVLWEEDCFDLILDGEDVPRPKPDPMGPQMAMERFGVLPEQTIVF